jgi:hypothetical protein
VKKVIAISCLLLLVCATMLLASAKKSNYTFSPDFKKVIATQGATHVIPNVQVKSSKKTTISGDLSTYPYGTYFCCFGYTVAGGGGGFPFQAWEAVAFTPASDATVTEIEAAVGSFETSNPGFSLSLYTDENGVPGTSLKTFHIASAPVYGDCCTVDTAKDATGIAVTAGTQYWIVASTDNKEADFEGGWAMNDTDERQEQYTVASWCKGSSTYCGSNSGKWIAGVNGDPVQAYAVLGN